MQRRQPDNRHSLQMGFIPLSRWIFIAARRKRRTDCMCVTALKLTLGTKNKRCERKVVDGDTALKRSGHHSGKSAAFG